MTVAIIGTGRIGAATAKIYAGFGAKVVGLQGIYVLIVMR
jgi:D-lactate dehydrogenase